MADGLSQEEKDTLMKVMERAKEFEQTNKEGRLQIPTEGQLYKWTNPLKGWQPRWFYVNHEQGVLHYCMSEEKRKQPPRASLHLWGAVVSPSEEDSQSFIIQGANSECYRLKAANAKDRQSWVSKMRTEVEHANTLAVTPLSPSDKSTVSLSGNSTQSMTITTDTNSIKNTNNTTTPTKKHGRKSQLSAPLNLSLNKMSHKKRHKRSSLQGGGGGGGDNGGGTYTDDVTVFPGGDGMLDSLTRLQNQQETLVDQLEASFTEIGVSADNKDILLLKATSYSAVQSVHDTLAMMNIQLGLTSSGGSPVHNTLSPINAQSPSRRVPLRHKRPMSMVDTSSRSYQAVENDLDNLFVRSTSAVEVTRDRRKVPPRVTSKEAP